MHSKVARKVGTPLTYGRWHIIRKHSLAAGGGNNTHWWLRQSNGTQMYHLYLYPQIIMMLIRPLRPICRFVVCTLLPGFLRFISF